MILFHNAHHTSQLADANILDVNTVNQYLARDSIIKSWNKVHKCRLPGSGFYHDGNGLSFFDFKIDVIKNLMPVLVRKIHVFKRNLIIEFAEFLRIFYLYDIILRIQNLVDSLH